MFSVQRRVVEQGRQTIHRSVELEERANDAALDGLSSWRSVQQASNDATRTAAVASIDAMASMMPGADASMRDLHDVVERQFDAADEMSEESWDALHDVMAENTRAYEEFADQYLEMVDRSYDGVVDMLDRLAEETPDQRVSVTE
jgi:hypothetical protein